MTKKRKSKRKSTRKKLGAGSPEYFKDHSPIEQLELVLDLVKKSNLKDVVTDLKTGNHPVFNTKIWSKLTYFNAYSVMGGAHREHMKSIVYMLEHPVHQHKTYNKDKWKKSINDAIYKGNYLAMFEHKKYKGPLIKEKDSTRITLKDLTIILLEHRLKLLHWLNEQKITAKKAEMPKAEMPKAEMQKAEQVPNAFNLERTPPNHWNDEIVRPIPDTFHT